MISCRRAAELASKELDTELRPRERVALGVHRLVCGACRRFRTQLAEIDRAVTQTLAQTLAGPGGNPSVALPDAARARLDAALGSELRRDGG